MDAPLLQRQRCAGAAMERAAQVCRAVPALGASHKPAPGLCPPSPAVCDHHKDQQCPITFLWVHTFPLKVGSPWLAALRTGSNWIPNGCPPHSKPCEAPRKRIS